MDLPKVSIILPTFNRVPYGGGQSFLKKAIQSVCSQLYPSELIELVICNDGSTDATGAYLAKDSTLTFIKSHIGTLKVITNSSNEERAVSRNKCIDNCQGDLIFLQEDDDISYSNRVLRQVAYFEGNPQCGILGGKLDYWKDNTKIENYWKPPFGYLSGPKNRELMLTRAATVVATPTLAFRREVFDKYRFRHDFIPAEDFDLLIRASKDFEIHNLQGNPIVTYRVHDSHTDSTVQQTRKRLAWEEATMKEGLVR